MAEDYKADDSLWSQVERDLNAEIDQAEDYIKQNVSAGRSDRWDRYYGRKLGNETKGHSKYISKDVMDTIEWAMPYFIRTFVSGDPKINIRIEGQDPKIGKALMKKIGTDLSEGEPNHFKLFYCWFKDALVSDTAFVKVSWNYDTEMVDLDIGDASEQQLAQAEQQGIQITGADEAGWVFPHGLMFRNVKGKIEQTNEDTIYSGNIPHWEFIVHPKKRDINDEFGCGHQTEVTLDYLRRVNRAMGQDEDGEDYFRDLERFAEGAGGEDIQTTIDRKGESEKSSYRDEWDDKVDETDKGPGKTILLTEWYTRYDLNEDGYLEHCTAWYANGNLIRYEENEDGFIPISVLMPIIDCFKFFGVSLAELIQPIQNLKTMLTRRILDNYDYFNKGLWLVDPKGAVDKIRLANAKPKDIITGIPGSIENLNPGQMDMGGSLALLNYFDQVKEDRSGTTKLGKGVGDDTKTDTAGGINMLLSQGNQRLDMVARVFAETGIKDFYKKVIWLYQKNVTEPFTVELGGQEMQLTPEQIQGKVIATVNMGVESAVGAAEAQKIERILSFLGNLNQQYPGLLGEEEVHTLSSKYVASMGFIETNDFIADLQTFLKKNAETKQQAQHGQQMAQQAEMMPEMGKQKIEAAKVSADKEKTMLEAQQKQEEMKLEMVKLMKDLESKEGIAADKDLTDRLKLMLEYMVPDAKTRLSAQVNQN